MPISVERQGAIATVTIDRPDRANSVDAEMHRDLVEVWGRLELDPEVDAVVLTGAGRVFCAGGDRDGWGRMVEDRRYRRQRLREARAIVVNMLRCELPLVAAVNGAAIGLGSSLVLACDVVVMAESAYLRDPHVASGLVAGDGGAALLPELLPPAVARPMVLLGRPLTAGEAVAHHLAVEATSSEALLERAMAVAGELAAQPREALRDTKRAMNLSLLARIAPALEVGSAAEESSFDTEAFADRGR